ncbi:MAG: hypothetical protein Kow0089_03670 [Desulfobulbaceae bacterium]
MISNEKPHFSKHPGGYADDPTMANYERHGLAGVVPKHYRVEKLAAAMAGLLQK